MNGPNVERRDSGPAHLDRTSDAWFEPELTDEQIEATDDLWGVEGFEVPGPLAHGGAA